MDNRDRVPRVPLLGPGYSRYARTLFLFGIPNEVKGRSLLPAQVIGLTHTARFQLSTFNLQLGALSTPFLFDV